MCGIFGLITKRNDIPVATIIREGLQRVGHLLNYQNHTLPDFQPMRVGF